MTVASLHVSPPGMVTGVASMIPEGDVDVTATIDGVEIDGSPDEIMEGSVNEFGFQVTEEMRGKTIVLTATGPDGSKVTRMVTVD